MLYSNMEFQKQGNKYSAKTTTYNGHTYHSMREANYAAELDLRVRAGELKECRPQVSIELRVNGVKICTYTIDFLEIDKNGGEVWTEVKGFETPEWRPKSRLFDVLHPDLDKQVTK